MPADKPASIPHYDTFNETADHFRRDFESIANKATILTRAIAQGSTEQSKELFAEPLKLVTDIAGGAAIGLAFSALPKWAAIPVTFIASAPLLALARRSSLALKDTGDALLLADKAPDYAQKKIAESLGPVITEGALMAGTGIACSATAHIFRWHFAKPPEISLRAKFQSSQFEDEDISAFRRFSQPSLYYPRLKSIPEELARLPIDTRRYKALTLREALSPVDATETARQHIGALNHAEINSRPDKYLVPTLSRAYQNVSLSSQGADDSLAQLYRSARESVVRIEVESHVDSYTGSGFFVSKDGVIATAYHLVDGSKQIKVRPFGERQYRAKVIASDRDSDLALLKINKQDAAPLALSSATVLPDGAPLYVIGHPLGSRESFLSPAIFHRTEEYGIETRWAGALVDEGRPCNHISYFATTFGGNSGGPVLNSLGEVVGIHVRGKLYRDDTGIGYGLSSSELKPLLARANSAPPDRN